MVDTSSPNCNDVEAEYDSYERLRGLTSFAARFLESVYESLHLMIGSFLKFNLASVCVKQEVHDAQYNFLCGLTG